MCFVCVDDVEWEELEWGELAFVIGKGNVPDGEQLCVLDVKLKQGQGHNFHRHPNQEGVEFQRSHWNIDPKEPRIRAELVFLTDGRAISYAESCMGIVEHYRLGEIVGAPTAGANGNINRLTVPGGYLIIWTGMKVTKHDDTRHHRVGILPTVPCRPTVNGIAAGRDELLERGIETLRDKTR